MHEKGETLHLLCTFRRLVPVQIEFVPVHFRIWSFLAKLYRYNLGLTGATVDLFPVSTRFRLFDITSSFLI